MIKYALIVAGGSGSRMQSAVPKQFLELNGTPVLMHTIRAFQQYSAAVKIIVVLPEEQFDYWQQLTAQHQFTIPHQLVAGGKTRSHSVKNGLAVITDDGLVAIHDGVRPLASTKLIDACFTAAGQHGSGVAAVPPKDSLRQVNGGNHSVDRNKFRLMQTPQTFKTPLIKSAYETASHIHGFTDDATVAEQAGHQITLVEGDYRNIKITTPEDLKIAQALLSI